MAGLDRAAVRMAGASMLALALSWSSAHAAGPEGRVTWAAAWIVPKKYVERVGDDGFKKAPVGAGPYRFVSFHDRVMFGPVIEPAFLNGVGPRVAQDGGLGVVANHRYSAPYEDLTLTTR
jgi:hypothetical protein